MSRLKHHLSNTLVQVGLWSLAFGIYLSIKLVFNDWPPFFPQAHMVGEIISDMCKAFSTAFPFFWISEAIRKAIATKSNAEKQQRMIKQLHEQFNQTMDAMMRGEFRPLVNRTTDHVLTASNEDILTQTLDRVERQARIRALMMEPKAQSLEFGTALEKSRNWCAYPILISIGVTISNSASYTNTLMLNSQSFSQDFNHLLTTFNRHASRTDLQQDKSQLEQHVNRLCFLRMLLIQLMNQSNKDQGLKVAAIPIPE